jgi:transposase
MNQTTRREEFTSQEAVLHLSFDLGWSEWKLAFGTTPGQRPRLRTVAARDLDGLLREIERAKERFELPSTARVVSCYEAGRDGFWLHRYLLTQGIDNLVVDSSSIEVSRRARRAKTDRLDAEKLLSHLIRSTQGEKVFSVLRVPNPQQEDNRQGPRELGCLKEERTAHRNRIKSLLAGQGIRLEVNQDFLEQLDQVRLWDGGPLPAELRQRLLREHERLALLQKQIKELERQRREAVREAPEVAHQQVKHLLKLRGVGDNSAWLLVREFFGWRQFQNGRELGALAGLVPMPHQSGDLDREQGISKAGNRRVRTMLIEIAWTWVRFQPRSRLTLWFQQRYGPGNGRSRRVGIVATARRLLIALWRYLNNGVVPDGAEFKTT